MPLSAILTEKAKKCFYSWLALDDMDCYKLSVLRCLRSLFAFVNTRSVSTTTYATNYQYNKALIIPSERIDKRLFAKTSVAIIKPKKEKDALAEHGLKESRSAVTLANAGTSLLKPASIRDEIMRGNGYITASCFIPDKVSLYQASYK